jgi:hypothetical protein
VTIDKDKLIYTTPDGLRSYDPLSLRRKLLLASKNRLNEWVALYNDALDEVDALTAEDSLVAATRAAFVLPPMTEPNGVSDKTVLEYLSHLLEWLSAPLSPMGVGSPIDRPCTDCPPPSFPKVPQSS